MFNPFDTLKMVGNYEQRKVDRYEDDELLISTAMVTDVPHSYETGVAHLSYNNGAWVIVEGYETREEAQKGHKKWIKTMTCSLPKDLKDINTDEVFEKEK